MILTAIGRRILTNPAWRQLVFTETSKAWNSQQAHVPAELAAAQAALAKVERKINNLVDRIEDGGGQELDARLKERCAEKRELTEKIERLQRSSVNRPQAPTAEWVSEQLDNLGDVLSEPTPAAAHALRDLVGGRIVVTEIRRPDQQRHHLQGRFTIRAAALACALLKLETDNLEASSVSVAEEIIIDFRDPPQHEAESERVKELVDQDWLMIDIAKEMGKHKSYVRKLLKHWYESRDLPVPDGRTRRSTLSRR